MPDVKLKTTLVHIAFTPSTTEDTIFDLLSGVTLLRHGRTCRAIHSQVHSYARRKFRLQKLLAPSFSLPPIGHLRQLQASTGMLISVSTALQFFDRVIYPESDLNLYPENAHGACERIGSWLIEVVCGYIPRPSSSNATFIDDLSQIQENRREASPPAFIEPCPMTPLIMRNSCSPLPRTYRAESAKFR